MDKSITLPEALGEYASSNPARFHMPGHKGVGLDGFFQFPLQQWDVTELDGTDNLHAPQGVIQRAETDMARTYGAKRSFLLVNGSTCGVHAMLLSLGIGKRLLLFRDNHRSAAAGAALAGLNVTSVFPEPGGVATPQTVDMALSREPADAVLIVNPNFYGLCADVAKIAEVTHRHGALLFVDSAHGAHFPFSDKLPASPANYADLWVVSAHKTLNALTQSAILHLGDCRISETAVQRVLSIIQTSSPSYLLMTSLDWARHSASPEAWTAHVARINAFRKKISELNGISIIDESRIGKKGVVDIDPTRLCLCVNERGIDGYAAMRSLQSNGVIAEMADMSTVVFITTPTDPDEWYDKLYEAIRLLPYGTKHFAPMQYFNENSRQEIGVREALLGESELVPLRSSIGRIAAQSAGVYPPGTAILFPGERITQHALDFLLAQRELGATLFGLTNEYVYCTKE